MFNFCANVKPGREIFHFLLIRVQNGVNVTVHSVVKNGVASQSLPAAGVGTVRSENIKSSPPGNFQRWKFQSLGQKGGHTLSLGGITIQRKWLNADATLTLCF